MALKLSFYIFIALLFTSCNKDVVLDKTQMIDVEKWSYGAPVVFYTDISDTVSVYSMHLIISHSKEYAYENIYMKIYTDFPSKEDREEQITVNLAEKNGQWIGKCSAQECKVKVYLLDQFKFPESGKYSFKFEQFTREENLEGIHSLNLRLEKKKPD
jgi:gliding motility-associated lipoprotein GldH